MSKHIYFDKKAIVATCATCDGVQLITSVIDRDIKREIMECVIAGLTIRTVPNEQVRAMKWGCTCPKAVEVSPEPAPQLSLLFGGAS